MNWQQSRLPRVILYLALAMLAADVILHGLRPASFQRGWLNILARPNQSLALRFLLQRCRLLQPAGHGRAADQRRQKRRHLDAAVLPPLRRQCCSTSTACAGLQPRQLPAHAGAAGRGGAVVDDHVARAAGEDRRQDRPPRPIDRVSDGRGRGAGRSVPGNSECDRHAPPVATGPMLRIGVIAGRLVYRRETCAQIRGRGKRAACPPSPCATRRMPGRNQAAALAKSIPEHARARERLRLRIDRLARPLRLLRPVPAGSPTARGPDGARLTRGAPHHARELRWGEIVIGREIRGFVHRAEHAREQLGWRGEENGRTLLADRARGLPSPGGGSSGSGSIPDAAGSVLA